VPDRPAAGRGGAEDLDDETSSAGVAPSSKQQKQYATACARKTPNGTTMLRHLGHQGRGKTWTWLSHPALGDPEAEALTSGSRYGTFVGNPYPTQFANCWRTWC